MAQKLNLPVIAEGVETSEQADVLMQAGCTGAQGDYYARPMPVKAFEQVILKVEGMEKNVESYHCKKFRKKMQPG